MLERVLSYEDIVLYRSLGDALVQKQLRAQLKMHGGSWMQSLLATLPNFGMQQDVHVFAIWCDADLKSTNAVIGKGKDKDCIDSGAMEGALQRD